jgi:hypothetical protein
MSASDQLNGRFDFQNLTTLLYGAPIDAGFDEVVTLDAGFDQGVSLDSMPDFNNVMPSVPDHLPDELVADIDSVRADS